MLMNQDVLVVLPTYVIASEQRNNTKAFVRLPPGAGGWGRGGVCPYNDLYGEASPERGTFFRPQVYKRVGISQAEVYKRVGKSAISVFKRAFNQNISNVRALWLFKH